MFWQPTVLPSLLHLTYKLLPELLKIRFTCKLRLFVWKRIRHLTFVQIPGLDLDLYFYFTVILAVFPIDPRRLKDALRNNGANHFQCLWLFRLPVPCVGYFYCFFRIRFDNFGFGLKMEDFLIGNFNLKPNSVIYNVFQSEGLLIAGWNHFVEIKCGGVLPLLRFGLAVAWKFQ